jgi:hypothetical protein
VRLCGLRMRMAVSYVLLTAAAVVLVEGIVVGLLLPRVLASSNNASLAAAARQAGADARSRPARIRRAAWSTCDGRSGHPR